MGEVCQMIADRGVPVVLVSDGPVLHTTDPSWPGYLSAALFGDATTLLHSWPHAFGEDSLADCLNGVLCCGRAQDTATALGVEFDPQPIREGSAGHPIGLRLASKAARGFSFPLTCTASYSSVQGSVWPSSGLAPSALHDLRDATQLRPHASQPAPARALDCYIAAQPKRSYSRSGSQPVARLVLPN
eukprot:TRINITY_DN27234_c0_g1_i1.p1 TRINITY_DN27234_c0_g1~~TRINITY_DN27234_c0_g1_i1.p1  ORF type:complete len:187 (+),score=35.90 TRINITY_DN27234_c0_g1_i1:392-952(+)